MNNQTPAQKNEKVVHVITGLGDGGAEGVLYRLSVTSTEFDHVIISLIDEGKYGPLLKESDIKVHALGMNNVLWTPIAFSKLVWLMIRERPKVVQTWMYHADLLGGIAARMVGCKRLFWCIRHSTLHPEKSSKITIKIAAICAKLSKWLPKKIICCACEAASVHEELGYDSSKLMVIQNGTDLERFQPDESKRTETRSNLEISDDQFVIGMVGRFDSQKDHRNLFNAMSQLKSKGKKFFVVLVGRNVTRENSELMEWIEASDLAADVMMLGSRPDVSDLLNSFDLHVLPSAFGEGFPNVVAEAMAVGIPCIATDVGDAATIVGETGWVVQPENSEELAEAIEAAMQEHHNDKSKWADRKVKSRERVATQFSLEAMVNRYEDAWASE